MSETLRERIIRHEGLRMAPYRCSRGFLTIGVGRNLEKKGISREEALHMLDNDIAYVKEHMAIAFPFILGMDDMRRDVLFEMCYQLGIGGVLKFKKMLAAIRDKDFAAASKAMLDSEWHKQTPERCKELAAIMLTGK